MKRHRIIINADDLGLSSIVNKQIKECIQRGVITSSSLMANAPCFEEGVEIAKSYPNISIGVHLNIIEFSPLTNISVFRKYGIVDKDGNFINRAIFDVKIDDELKDAIFEEWDSQITKIERAGIKPTHCDSHQHTHTISGLEDVLIRVLEKHDIKKVRRVIIPSIHLLLRQRSQEKAECPSTDTIKIHLKTKNLIRRRINFFVVKYKNWQWNRRMSSRYLMTDAFASFFDFYNNIDLLQLGKEDSIVELMCHPGNTLFQNETNCLLNNFNVYDDNLKLITYREL